MSLITRDILPIQFEIHPWISSPRIMWNETRGVLCTHVGYLRCAPNVTAEKVEIFFPNRGSNPDHWTQSPTLDHVAIKAGFYHKAEQVQSTLVISNSKGLYETLRDIRSSTYQIYGTEEKTINRTTTFNRMNT